MLWNIRVKNIWKFQVDSKIYYTAIWEVLKARRNILYSQEQFI